MTDAVRPTQACLDALGIPLPDLGTRLSDSDHLLVRKAQAIPAAIATREAERIVALTDRVWLKVKASRWRGAVGDVSAELPASVWQFHQSWWLCAAGIRRGDSGDDFYASLAKSAHAGGPHSCETGFLLPREWDTKRLMAEAGVNAERTIRGLVVQAARESLLNSDMRVLVVGDRDVRVRVAIHEDGEAYVAVGATGTLDHTFMVTLLSAIPGLLADDWLPEPDGNLQIEVAPGEVVWSALLPAETQQQLMGDIL
jgi:hypothetical protein